MPSLLVVQNDPDKSLGRLAAPLQRAGAELDVRSPTAELPDASEHDGLIVLPGLANPVDDTTEIRRARGAIDEALAAGLPILGLCLGGQLLAQALGGTVHPCPPELGFGEVQALPAATNDPLLAAAPKRFPIFHAHTYAFTPPENAQVLLANDVSVQACRIGEAWAFQCHPEIADEWVQALAAGLRGRDGQLLGATTGFFESNGVTAEKLEHDAVAAEPAMRALADSISRGFVGRLS
jgi:GMP synthase (glutamine-hydrolysing)